MFRCPFSLVLLLQIQLARWLFESRQILLFIVLFFCLFEIVRSVLSNIMAIAIDTKKNNRRWFNIFISKTACNFHNFIERKEKNYLLNEIGSVQFDIQVMYDLFFVVSDSKHPELSLIFVLLHCHRPIHIGIYSLIATLSTCSVAACIFHPYYHTHRRTNAHSCQGILPIEWYWAMCIIKDIGICEKKNQPSVALCGVCARAHSEHCNASCASDVICNQQQ